MADTVLRHLTDLKESKARTAEYESVTQERDTMLPGKLQKQTVDIENARQVLSTLQKDAVLGDMIRENQLYTAEATKAYIESDMPGFLADVTLAHELKANQNEVSLAVSKADLVVGRLQPITEALRAHATNLGNPNYDAIAGINQIEQQYGLFNQEMKRLDFMGDPDEQGIARFPGLPAGAEFGEQISTEHLPSFEMITRSAQLVSEKGSARLLQDIKNRGSVNPLDIQKDQFSLLKDYKEQFKASLITGFSGAYEVNTEGKGGTRDNSDYGSANEALRNALSQMAMNMGTDPSDAVNQLSQMTQDAYQLHEDQIDNSMLPARVGPGGGNYYTYVPRNVKNNNTQEYINMLHDYIANNAENQTPQQSADKFLADNINNVFSNMVTSTDAQ